MRMACCRHACIIIDREQVLFHSYYFTCRKAALSKCTLLQYYIVKVRDCGIYVYASRTTLGAMAC